MTRRHSGLVLSRRKVLLGASALAAAPIAAPYVARAADPIKIGLLLAKTGQIAGQTEYLANGSMLALEQRNGTIMGQPAELVWLDEPSPQGAKQLARSGQGIARIEGIEAQPVRDCGHELRNPHGTDFADRLVIESALAPDQIGKETDRKRVGLRDGDQVPADFIVGESWCVRFCEGRPRTFQRRWLSRIFGFVGHAVVAWEWLVRRCEVRCA